MNDVVQEVLWQTIRGMIYTETEPAMLAPTSPEVEKLQSGPLSFLTNVLHSASQIPQIRVHRLLGVYPRRRYYRSVQRRHLESVALR